MVNKNIAAAAIFEKLHRHHQDYAKTKKGQRLFCILELLNQKS